MDERKRLRLKKFNLHPITAFILLSIFVILLSSLLTSFSVETNYNKVNSVTLNLENVMVQPENLLSFSGFKYIISNAIKNFVSFAPLSNLIIAIIGIAIANATGLLDTFIRRQTFNVSNKFITFSLIFLAVFSSIINDVGYVILIPLAAIIYYANGRSPLLGITTAFGAISFGYGATLFAGSMEVALTPLSTVAARLISDGYHVPMLANLFILIVSTIIVSIVGTLVVENILVKKIGRYRTLDSDEADEITREFKREELIEDDQKRLELEYRERRGLKNSYTVAFIFLLIFIYMITPNFPMSGMLLDMSETTYLGQLFGETSYFQEGFTFMVSMLFVVAGLAYGFGAKTLKSDSELIEKANEYLKHIGSLLILVFVAAQFIAIFKKSNIGTIIICLLADLVKSLAFTGIPLILLVIIVIAVANLFVPSSVAKWTILSPVVVPMMMQSNIDPAFAQFILRASESITRGMTPLLAYFVIYLGYLNIYNKNKEPITIGRALSYVSPFALLMGITWIAIIIFWYVIGLPIGPDVFPTM